ncbi:MAG: dTDP-4-dehydrorhamnose reductase [bacterium]
MRIMVTGASGLLGQKMVEVSAGGGHETLPLDYVAGLPTEAGPVRPVDITDPVQVETLTREFRPDWVMNAAAYTAVDDSEGAREKVYAVNVRGVGHLQAACEGIGARLAALSTDYVFDGTAGPYREEAERHPLGVYGESKAAMEELLEASGWPSLVVRTMVLYGAARRVRTNFGLWVVESLRAGERIRVVTDQMGNPTLASDLARLILGMMEQGGEGTCHAAGRDRVSRYTFAAGIARTFGLDADRIEPVSTGELGQRAERPLESGFVLERLREDFGLEPLGLEAGLERFREEVEHFGGSDGS